MKRKKILSLLLTLLFLTTLLTAVTVPAGAKVINSTTVSLLANEAAAISSNDDCSKVTSFKFLANSTLTIEPSGVVTLMNAGEMGCLFKMLSGATLNLHGTLTAASGTTFNTTFRNGVTYNVYLNDGAVLDSAIPTSEETFSATVNYYGFVPTSADTDMGTASITKTTDYVTKGQSYTVTATANDGYEFVNWTDENGTQVSDQASFSYTIPALTKDSKLTANFEASTPVTPLACSATFTKTADMADKYFFFDFVKDSVHSYYLMYHDTIGETVTGDLGKIKEGSPVKISFTISNAPAEYTLSRIGIGNGD